MQKWLIFTAVAGVFTGCSGHNLDSPLKTCRTVTAVLAGNKAVIWHGERQTEQTGVQLQVILDFRLEDQPETQLSQAVCVYGLSSQDMDYRNAMGEYVNVPTKLFINGRPIPDQDLMQAINRAT
ncbi:MAG: hypothetical protein ACK4RS_07885, partial [Thiothrix sp.]